MRLRLLQCCIEFPRVQRHQVPARFDHIADLLTATPVTYATTLLEIADAVYALTLPIASYCASHRRASTLAACASMELAEALAGS